MTILVTGAAGFIGSAIVRDLVSKKYKVRALLRRVETASNLHEMPVEIFIGDILDSQIINQAMEGVDIVFHTAALYQATPWYESKPKEIYSVNIKGTTNICEASLKHRVKRVIYTSTAGTIGKRVDGLPANEDIDLNLFQKRSHYEKSKAEAEKVFLSYHAKGLEVISINPSFIYGERDSRPSPTGEMIVKFLNRNYPCYFDAVASVASLDMVVEAHIKAMTLGESGQRYIIAHRRHYALKEIFDMLSQITGIKLPWLKLPIWLVYAFACVEELFWKIVTFSNKVRPLIASEFVQYFTVGARYDSSRAFKTFNLKESDFKETVQKEVGWYVKNGYVKRNSRIKYYKKQGKL